MRAGEGVPVPPTAFDSILVFIVLVVSLTGQCWEDPWLLCAGDLAERAIPEPGAAAQPAPTVAWSWATGAACSHICSLLPGKDPKSWYCCLVTLPVGTESHISSQVSAKLQETERMLRDQEVVLKALTLERDQAVQALRTRGLLPEREVQVSAAVLPEPRPGTPTAPAARSLRLASTAAMGE